MKSRMQGAGCLPFFTFHVFIAIVLSLPFTASANPNFLPPWNSEISQNRPFLVDFLEPMAVKKSNTNPLECQLSVNNAKTSTCNLKRYQNVGTDSRFLSISFNKRIHNIFQFKLIY
jgi:hypothetical protein